MRARYATLFILTPLFVMAGAFAADTELAHAIFVKVNGRTITQDQVVEAAKFLIKREFNDITPEDEDELDNIQQAALRDLVRATLIHDAARQNNIEVTPDMNRRAERSSGLKPDEITPTIRKIILADDLFDEIMMAIGTPVTQISPREVKDFYAKNRDEFRSNTFLIVRTIFFATGPDHPQSVMKQQGEQLIRQLSAVPLQRRTQAFGRAAMELSQDIFAEFGGLLTGDSEDPWIPKEFNNVNPNGDPMFPLPMYDGIRRLSRSGELRLAVSTDGIHILYCENVRGGEDMPWGEAKRIIEYVLTDRKRNEKLRAWLNRIYDRSDVRWHDGTVYPKSALTQILLPSERVPQEDGA